MTENIMTEEGNVHSSFDLRFIKKLLKDMQAQGKEQTIAFHKLTGEFLTYDEVLKSIEELERAGFEVMPACDDCDEKGYCPGH